jgi:hypothetical protein
MEIKMKRKHHHEKDKIQEVLENFLPLDLIFLIKGYVVISSKIINPKSPCYKISGKAELLITGEHYQHYYYNNELLYTTKLLSAMTKTWIRSKTYKFKVKGLYSLNHFDVYEQIDENLDPTLQARIYCFEIEKEVCIVKCVQIGDGSQGSNSIACTISFTDFLKIKYIVKILGILTFKMPHEQFQIVLEADPKLLNNLLPWDNEDHSVYDMRVYHC